MMKKVLAVLMVALFVITGCNSSSEFDRKVEDGKEAMIKEDYDKALGLFESALEEKNDDEEVKILIKQTEKMIDAIEEDDANNIDGAIALFKEVESMEGGSDILGGQAEERRGDLVRRQQEIEKYNRQLDEAEALKDNGKYKEAKDLLDTIISNTDNVEYLEEQQKRATEILKEVYTGQLDKAETLKDSGNHDEARALLDTIISDTDNIDYLEEQNERATAMLAEVESAIDK